LFTQEWASIPRSKITAAAKTHLNVLKEWIDTWIFTLEHEYQFLDSLKQFNDNLESSRKILGSATLQRVEDIVNIMESISTKWAKCYKKAVMDLEHTTSSIGESMNSSMKKFAKGPMAATNLTTSAATAINHSKHLDEKREQRIAFDLNLVRVNTFMEQQNVLTSYSQLCAQDLFIQRAHYFCVRDRPNELLICHKNTFYTSDLEPLRQLQVGFCPKYSNVHRVVFNEDGSLIMCTSCKKKARKGIPCIHVMVALQFCHPKMFHPRYLKAYNSWMYDTQKGMRRSLDGLREQHKLHPNSCDISAVYTQLDFSGIEYRNGCTSEIYLKMLALERMHNLKQVLYRGSNPPAEYFEMIRDDTMSFASGNCEDDSDGGSFCEDIGNEDGADARVSAAGDQQKKDEHDVGMFSYLESFSKDMLKVVDGHPDLKKKYQSKLDTLLLEATDECNRAMNIEFSQDSAMISIAAETEKSPHRTRYKRRHEK